MLLMVGHNAYSLGQIRAGRSRERDPNRFRVVAELGNSKASRVARNRGIYGETSLRNPINDAKDMAAALHLLGFEVIQRTNANQREMEDAVNECFGRIRKGSAALFYFSGHGVQAKGENY